MGSLKIFLTTGITITINEKDIIDGNVDNTLEDLYDYITIIKKGRDRNGIVEFSLEIEDEDKTYHHDYAIPKCTISWYMIEEVEE